MIEVKNKVVFLRNSVGSIDKNFQNSLNLQGQLKKRITKVKKLKIADKLTVVLSGSYKNIEIKIDPAESKHADRIKAMLTLKEK